MADIDVMGAMFDQLVARNRKMDAARVKSYQAGTFMGQPGVVAKLADAVMAPDEAMS
jgi:ClpP class serine protease